MLRSKKQQSAGETIDSQQLLSKMKGECLTQI
jgi:hypothetical protein